jgi:hypothetical protein
MATAIARLSELVKRRTNLATAALPHLGNLSVDNGRELVDDDDLRELSNRRSGQHRGTKLLTRRQNRERHPAERDESAIRRMVCFFETLIHRGPVGQMTSRSDQIAERAICRCCSCRRRCGPPIGPMLQSKSFAMAASSVQVLACSLGHRAVEHPFELSHSRGWLDFRRDRNG